MSNKYTYEMSMNILRALGGDTDAQYGSVDEIWNAIDEIYGASGDGIDLVPLNLDIIENGSWSYNITEEVDAYVPVDITVNVPQKYTDEDVNQLQDTARTEGYNSGYETGKTDGYNEGFTAGSDDGYADGYAEGLEDGAVDQKALLEEVTLTENGIYEKEDGYNKVTVDVAVPTFETESLSVSLTENGDYSYTPTADGYSSVDVTVNVPEKVFETETLNVTLTENGDYTYASDKDGYSVVSVNVNVAGSGSGSLLDFPGIGWSNTIINDYNSVTVSQINTSKTLKEQWENASNISTQNTIGREITSNCALYPVLDISKALSSGIPQPTAATYFPKQDFTVNYLFQNGSANLSFDGAKNLTYIEPDQQWDYFVGLYMFRDCSSLTSIPEDYYVGKRFRNHDILDNWFYNCTSLTTVPLFDTSNVIQMQNIFGNCTSLTTVPLFDTSNVKYINSMFNGCTNLTTVPLFDTSNVTTMASMFYNCANLTTIPQFDTSNVTDMSNMFYYCTSLTTIPLFDTSNVKYMNNMFYSCTSLTTIPLLDCSKTTNISLIFGYSWTTLNMLTELGGFKNLGMQSNLSLNTSNFFNVCPNLTYESIMNVINNLYDRAAAGYSVLTLKLHANTLALLSDDDKAIATNKGWTIA